jgi:hypothetical protein
MGPFDVLGLAVVCLAAVKILQALGHAIASRRRVSDMADPATLAEIDALRMRLAEVEERLDFAERLLSRTEAMDQLPGSTRQ